MQSENTHVRTSYGSSQSKDVRDSSFTLNTTAGFSIKKILQQELWLLRELSRNTENQGQVALSFCLHKDNA